MAIYRNIHITFWQDDFVLELTPEEKYFYLYLLTNSKTTQCGVYKMPLQVACLETGYNAETVKKLFKNFEEKGKLILDRETGELLLVNWARFNWSSSPKVLKCIDKELKMVKSEKLYRYCMDMRSQQEQEQKQKQEQYTYAPDSLPDDIIQRLREWVKAKSVNVDIDSSIESCLAHHRAKGNKFKCWYSAMQTWINNDIKWSGGGQPPEPKRHREL